MNKRILIRIVILVFTIVTLAGCVSPNISATPTAFTPVITPEVTQLTPTQTAVKNEPVSNVDNPCASNGTTERYQIDSVLLNAPLFFTVYLPPCYDSSTVDGYPVLYALHGQNFTDEMWLDLGLADTADHLISQNEVPPFVVVMPYEEYFFRSPEPNNFPAALLEEIIPWVEDQLNVCTGKACRAIGGISRGASWALRVGLAEWNFFGAIGAHSLPTFVGDLPSLPDRLDEIPTGEEPRIYMDTGRFDPEIKNTYRYEYILSQKGVPHEWHLNEGRHNEAYWAAHLEEYLRWYGAQW